MNRAQWAAWWTEGYGPSLAAQHPQTGDILYSPCGTDETFMDLNSEFQPAFDLGDKRPPINTSFDVVGWRLEKQFMASIFYPLRHEILHMVFQCDIARRTYKFHSEWPAHDIGLFAGDVTLAACYVQETKTFELVYYVDGHSKFLHVGYAEESWQHKGIVSPIKPSGPVSMGYYEVDPKTKMPDLKVLASSFNLPRSLDVNTVMAIQHVPKESLWSIRGIPEQLVIAYRSFTEMMTLKKAVEENFVSIVTNNTVSNFTHEFGTLTGTSNSMLPGIHPEVTLSLGVRHNRATLGFYIGNGGNVGGFEVVKMRPDAKELIYEIGTGHTDSFNILGRTSEPWPRKAVDHLSPLAVAYDAQKLYIVLFYLSDEGVVEVPYGDNGFGSDRILEAPPQRPLSEPTGAATAGDLSAKGGLGTGGKVGLALGVVLGAGMLVALWYTWRRWRHGKAKEEHKQGPELPQLSVSGGFGYDPSAELGALAHQKSTASTTTSACAPAGYGDGFWVEQGRDVSGAGSYGAGALRMLDPRPVSELARPEPVYKTFGSPSPIEEEVIHELADTGAEARGGKSAPVPTT